MCNVARIVNINYWHSKPMWQQEHFNHYVQRYMTNTVGPIPSQLGFAANRGKMSSGLSAALMQ